MSENNRSYEFDSFHKTKSIFFHIPKAAGTSIATALYGGPAAGHIDVPWCLASIGEQKFSEYFKFAFVRDPITRLISAFNFLKSGGMNDEDAAWSEKNLRQFKTLEDFVFCGLPQRHILEWWHFRPQYVFLLHPVSRRLCIDFIGKFESLDRDFRIISKVVNPIAKLAHENRTAFTSESVYGIDVTKRIAKIYRRDYRIFYPESEVRKRYLFSDRIAKVSESILDRC